MSTAKWRPATGQWGIFGTTQGYKDASSMKSALKGQMGTSLDRLQG